MPVRKVAFVEDEIYHVCSRGVEKRNIFIDEKDYFRFIHDLYEFNDEEPALNIYYRKPYETGSHKVLKARKPIVEIMAYALMPNHYHLLLSQIKNRGITTFMHKLGAGYATYFNQKYQRAGVLFQGPFNAVHVEREAHMLHLPFYIHANPLDLRFPEWRNRNIKDPQKALKFLEKYRWSSFPDYVGIKNFPSVIKQSPLVNPFGESQKYHALTLSLLQEMDLTKIADVALEDI